MSMAGYTKLFSTIVTSTIWREPKETKVLWITMLALSNKDGFVDGTIPGLAHLAGLTIPETEKALKTLESPDQYSRTQEHEGRRIEAQDGGWFLINHAKYREAMSKDDRREYMKLHMRAKRSKLPLADVNSKLAPLTHTEADTDTKAVSSIAPKARDRNPLFDALAAVCDYSPTEITAQAGARIAAALAEIKRASPNVTPEEISERGTNYHKTFRGAAITPTAMSKHWAALKSPEAKPKDYSKI